jgi:hypothetical protein
MRSAETLSGATAKPFDWYQGQGDAQQDAPQQEFNIDHVFDLVWPE